MFTWFRNLKIGRKLTLSFMLVIGMLVLVSVISIISLNVVTDRTETLYTVEGEIANLSVHSELALEEALGKEEQFMMGIRQNGYTEEVAALVKASQDHIDDILQNMAAIRELELHGEQIAKIAAIENAAQAYTDDFLATVQLFRDRGYVDTGIEGQFRQKAQETEAVVRNHNSDALLADLLTMRQHEKEYLAHNHDEDATSVQEASVQFKQDVSESDLSPIEQAELVQLTDEYLNLFGQYIDITEEIEDSISAHNESEVALDLAIEAYYEESLANQAVAYDEMVAVTQFATTATITVSIIAIIFAFVLAILLSRSISGAVNKVSSVAQRIAEGDLTVTIDVTSKDELGLMALAFRQMISNLRALIGQVQTSARQVSEASQQLNVSSDQAGVASQQVTQSIQQVATGTSQQTQSVSEATSNVEQIARASEGIARGAQEQAKAVQQTSMLIAEMSQLVEGVTNITDSMMQANNMVNEAAKNGVTAVAQTAAGIETIRVRTADVSQKVREMDNRSKEIGRIVETIDDIADKTDMLALNAAVEAARAGEHGRGFAVVADQVRKLSEDSKVATRDIATLIERVQETIDEAISAMDGAMQEVGRGTGLAQDTTESLNEIQEAVQQAMVLSQSINEATTDLKFKNEGVITASESVSAVVEENTAVAEEVAANSQEVTSVMETIASVSEENSAASEEVSASSEEMSAQIEEVVASSQELSALAEELYQATIRFYLGDEEENNHDERQRYREERPLMNNGNRDPRKLTNRPEPVVQNWGNGGPHHN